MPVVEKAAVGGGFDRVAGFVKQIQHPIEKDVFIVFAVAVIEMARSLVRADHPFAQHRTEI